MQKIYLVELLEEWMEQGVQALIWHPVKDYITGFYAE